MKAADIRDRITEFERLPARDLMDHQGNWRLHPQAQREALGGILRQVGIVNALLAYRSERNGGALTLIDGHLRKDEQPDMEWPVLVTDLTDAEADLVLALLDPLAAMAEAAGDKLAALMSGIETNEAGLLAVLDQQKAEADLAELMAQVEAELEGLQGDAPGDDGRGAGLASGRARVRPVVWMDDLADFEKALMNTGNPNRGEAMAQVCRSFLEHHGE